MLHDNAISTHTPARGVTDGAGRERYRSYNFYSHAREGRDPFSVSRYCRKIVDFYSHAREGRDDSKVTTLDEAKVDFYSHAREGRDSYILYFREITPPYNARRTYFFNDS